MGSWDGAGDHVLPLDQDLDHSSVGSARGRAEEQPSVYSPRTVIDWSGEHNFVARFDQSEMSIEQQDVGVRAWSGVHLLEVCVTSRTT